MTKVEKFTLHNSRDQSVLRCNLSGWIDPVDPKNDIFGPVIRYSWLVSGIQWQISDPTSRINLNLLPDASGFIAFEKGWTPQNSLLMDAYGQERIRLSVPWKLTKSKLPESGNAPTSFVGVGTPQLSPIDGTVGVFGVDAWVEHAGMYYFELNFHTGVFLWGTEIRD